MQIKPSHISSLLSKFAGLIMGLLIIIIPEITLGFAGEPIFRRIGIDQGLSQESVNTLLQDQWGFIWIGSNDGLRFYDGTSFRHFRHDPKNANSICGDNITSILEDREGKIWIGTKLSGLCSYNRITAVFTSYVRSEKNFKGPFSNKITCLFEDSEGLIWIGTKDAGISCFNPQTQNFSQYKSRYNSANTISGNNITCIGEDFEKNIWLGTSNNSLTRINKKSGKIDRIFTEQFSPERNTPATFISFQKSHEGKPAFYLINSFGEVFSITTHGTSQPIIAPKISLDKKPQQKDFSSAILDKKNNLWLGSGENGLHCISLDNSSKRIFAFDPKNKSGISSNSVSSLLLDKQGCIWIGTEESGLNFLNPGTAEFQRLFKNPLENSYLLNDDIHAIHGFGESLLIGTANGAISVFNKKKNQIKHIPIPNLKYNDYPITQIEHIGNGVFWIGTLGQGIWEFDLQKEQFKDKYLNKAENPNSPSSNFITVIKCDKKNNIWVGSSNRGLMRFNKESRTWEKFKNTRRDKESLQDNNIKDIVFGADGKIWLAHASSISEFNPSTNQFLNWSIEAGTAGETTPTINCMIIDHSNKILAGSNQGLIVLQANKGILINIDEKFGLPEEHIRSLCEDKQHRIWAGTTKGMISFVIPDIDFVQENKRILSKKIRSTLKMFDRSEGLCSDNFNPRVFFRDESNTLFWGGDAGLSFFNPDSISNNFFQSPCYITSIQISGKEYSMIVPNGSRYEMILQHKDNYLSFEFTGLNYVSQSKATCSYQLVGFDSRVIHGQGKNLVNYTNLPPGHYTFKVWSTENNGLLSAKPAEVKFKIMPPFWKKAWFFILLSLILSVLIWLFNYLRERKFRIDKIKLERTVEDRTRELKIAKEQAEKSMYAKETFLSTMSHEIRTPMNAVIAMSHLLIQENPKPEQEQNLNTLKSSAENLLVLINDILDFSKIDSGKIEFEKKPLKIKKLVEDLHDALFPAASDKGIQLRMQVDSLVPEVVVGDPVRLNQVLTNLVGNGIKFTHQGNVSLSVSLVKIENETVVLNFSVQDTGIGIVPEKHKIIFDSFEQASSDTTRKYGGTGLGLTITKRLLTLQNSEIKLESESGRGSRFFFDLAFGKSEDQETKTESISNQAEKINALIGRKILLIEDNAVNQLIAGKFLNKWGCEVTVADNGRIGAEKYRADSFDLILMDLQMPEMDGFESTRIIRETEVAENRTHTPIIALTAAALVEVREKVMEAGMDDYISKPFNPAELLDKMFHHIASGKV